MNISLLQTSIRDGNQLQLHSKADVSEFSQTLTMMEITGTVFWGGQRQPAYRTHDLCNISAGVRICIPKCTRFVL